MFAQNATDYELKLIRTRASQDYSVSKQRMHKDSNKGSLSSNCFIASMTESSVSMTMKMDVHGQTVP